MSKISKLLSFIKRFFSINGLLLTLLVGVLINFMSDSISEQKESQRYQELLQFEIRMNILAAGQVFDQYNENGVLTTETYLQDKVYHSGLESGLIFDIDPKLLPEITSFYMVTVPGYNRLLKDVYEKNDSALDAWYFCISEEANKFFDESIESFRQGEICVSEEKTHRYLLENNSKRIVEIWSQFFDSNSKVAEDFVPTQKRLNSWWLKLIMGDEALEVQKN